MKPARRVRWALFLLLMVVVGYLGLKLYGQHRSVSVYVRQFRPMPAALAKNLPLEKQRLRPLLLTEVPYAHASPRILPPEEIARVRAALAWSGLGLNWVDALHIQSPTFVWAETRDGRTRHHLVKVGSEWWRTEDVGASGK